MISSTSLSFSSPWRIWKSEGSADRISIGTQLRDLDKTPTQYALLSESSHEEGRFHSRNENGDVEVDSEVRYRMIRRKRGKSL